jgi:hypothetical protein
MREQDSTKQAATTQDAEAYWAADNEVNLSGGDPIEQQTGPGNDSGQPQTVTPPPTGG